MTIRLNRRNFIHSAACCTAAFGMSHGMMARIARACTPTARHLILIYFSGGPDWLDWLKPANSATMESIRPTLYAQDGGRLALGTTGWALNTSLPNLKALYDSNRVAFLPFTGYQNFTGSHDEARNTYLRGEAVRAAMMGTDGVFIRLAKQHASFDSRSCVFSVSGNDRATEPQNLAINIDDLTGLGFGSVLDSESGHPANTGFSALASVSGLNSQQSDLLEAFGVLQNDVATLQTIAATKPDYGLPNNGLSRDLEECSALISGFPTRSSCMYIDFGGHDTHGNQRNANNTLMSRFDNAVNAFLNDMATKGLSDSVAIYTMGDFGRTLVENDGEGTDHARSSLMMFIGSAARVNGGIYEAPPTSTELLDPSNGLPMKINHVDAQWEMFETFLGLQGVSQVFPGFSHSPVGFAKA